VTRASLVMSWLEDAERVDLAVYAAVARTPTHSTSPPISGTPSKATKSS